MSAKAIAKDTVVSIHYTLRGEDKNVIDSSADEPLTYLHGHGQLIPGLEKALIGKVIGDKVSVVVDPDQGYGEYEADMVLDLPKSKFPDGAPLELGAMFELVNDKEEPFPVRVIGVTDDAVKLDGNHPLAGKKLFFEVEIATLRAATPSELEHGHAHSGDGHKH